MADEHRSPDEIEREIARERSQLTDTLEEIQDRFSFESLSADVMNTVRGQSGDMARALSRSVKENPIPLALTVVGIAWLMLGSNRSSGRDYDDYERDLDAPDFRHTPRAGVVGERSATMRPDQYGMSPRPASYESYGSETWDSQDGEDGEGRWDRAKNFFADKSQAASDMGGGARDAAASSLKAGADSVTGSGRRAYASARDLGARLADGTQDLSEEARRRVVAARQRAYEAQAQAEHFARRSGEKAADLFEDQPLVVGALALAVGAAIGGMLPGTRREDEAFGTYRDQAFDEAERIYREERSKIEEVAKATGEEAKQAVRDIGDTAREAADRVAERAKTEADDKGVGSGLTPQS